MGLWLPVEQALELLNDKKIQGTFEESREGYNH